MDLSAVALMFFFGVLKYYQRGELTTVYIPSLGQLRGSEMTTFNGRSFQAFRGIPYAKPPTGDLRFQDPVPAESWGEDILDATKEGPTCVQFDALQRLVKGQEDCLALNVYTPSGNYYHDALPVMVYIHGGGFSLGSGNSETDMYGPGYILDRDVVLVTINYRLGPMGFLSTDDAEAPGNYGLLDQSLALKWVRDHICHFGGDPDLVTIFGESAGAASVEFQMLSPYSKGLFHRAIAQSGSAGCPWAIQTDSNSVTKSVAQLMDCPTSSSRDMLECLRQRDANEIVGTRKRLALDFLGGFYPSSFGPRIDVERETPFLSAHPAKLISEKKFNDVPLISGLTKDEGAFMAAVLASGNGEKLAAFNKDPITSVRYILGLENRMDGLEIATQVYSHYFGNQETEDRIKQFGQLSSDYSFFKCVDDSVKLFNRHSDYHTFYYQYAHRSQFTFVDLIGAPPDVDFGVSHADELFLMFSTNLTQPLSRPRDIQVSETLIDLWTSFAADGVPKSDHVTDCWLPLEEGQDRYLKIDGDTKMVDGPMPFHQNLKFWKSLTPQI